MPIETLYPIKITDLDKAVACLKDAFKNDPVWNAVFADDPNKDEALSAFYSCPILYGLKYGKVYADSENINGVAVWLPKKYANMGFWGMLRSGALKFGTKMDQTTMKKMSFISKQLGKNRKKLMGNSHYYYLMIIGVHSDFQGKGIGSKLLDAIKEDCRNEYCQLFLETETEENVNFYTKNGFQLLNQLSLDHLNLPMWSLTY